MDITKEMCAEKGGVHRRPWEVEVLTLGFVKAMGGGGMVEMVEMVEMYLLNKYTRHRNLDFFEGDGLQAVLFPAD